MLVIRGLVWTGGGRFVSQMLTWAITLVVIRLLTPADYGLLAMATVFGGFLAVLGQAGLGTAIVQAREMDEGKLRRVLGLVMLINAFLFLVQYAAAPAIARFFEEERLVSLIRVLGIQFLVSIFVVIPSALLNRELDFKRQSIVELLSVVLGALTSLFLAFAGFGVWSLVVGGLVTSALGALMINYVMPFNRWPDFSLRGLGGLIGFGGQVTASRVLWIFYSQADILIAGRVLGKEMLGFYSVSMHLASLPVQRISSMLNQVAFPAFARSQHEPDSVPRLMLKMIRILIFFAIPVMWGISSIAPEIVDVLLGDKWAQATLPLQLLPLVMPLTMLSPVLQSAFQGVGQGKVVLMNVATAAAIMPLVFLIGAQWGLLGLSVSWLVGYPIVFLINLLRMLPVVKLGIGDFVSATLRAVLCGAGMYVLVLLVRFVVGDSVSASLRMAVLILVGFVTYASLAVVLNRSTAVEVADLLGMQRIGALLGRG